LLLDIVSDAEALVASTLLPSADLRPRPTLMATGALVPIPPVSITDIPVGFRAVRARAVCLCLVQTFAVLLKLCDGETRSN
jgi:hypothetical protein